MGGIDNWFDATLFVENSTISDNTADQGGGVNNFLGDATITNSTISGNVATGTGGSGAGIQSFGSLFVANSTISGNIDLVEGGGAFVVPQGGPVRIANSTITGNSAGERGGGIFQPGTFGLVFRIELISTIVAGNSAPIGADIYDPFQLIETALNNLIGDSIDSGIACAMNGNICNIDPLLGPLMNNGGPTETHALLAGSPAINAGINPLVLLTDQRGFFRDDGNGVDIGAFEANSTPRPIPEPTTLALLGIALAGLVCARRRKLH